jgi:hypothetical protein
VPLSCNLGTLTFWNPLGHSRPVKGLKKKYGVRFSAEEIFLFSKASSLTLESTQPHIQGLIISMECSGKEYVELNLHPQKTSWRDA